LLEKDEGAEFSLSRTSNYNDIIKCRDEEIFRLEHEYKEDSETLITDARYGFIAGALKETYRHNNLRRKVKTETEIIDTFLTHKIFGFPVFIFFLWITFFSTFQLGKYPQQWIESFVGLVGSGFNDLLPDSVFKDLVVDGVIGGVGGVIVFLPNILILFFFISFMEDTGYMARAAFIMDRLMHKIGLHGKSFIPLIMGFGCNVPAIMATRTLENRNERLLTILINPFMSCSARLPVYILIIAAFFQGNEVSILFLVYGIGIFFAIFFAIIFKKTLFKSDETPFVMELPPYRLPTLKSTLRHMWHKGEHYLKKMGGVILIASIIIWALGYFPQNKEVNEKYNNQIGQLEQKYINQIEKTNGNDSIIIDQLKKELNTGIKSLEFERRGIHQENSYIGRIGKAIEPVMRPLGFDWKMSVSLLAGVAAKEIVVSTMGVLYQVDADPDIISEPLTEKLKSAKHSQGPNTGQPAFTPVSAFSFLMFILLYFPCVAVVAAVRREAGNWKWAIFMVFYTTTVAWIIAFLTYQIGTFFCG